MVSSIFGVFAKSPLGPVQAHMKKVAECAQMLLPFYQAVIKNDWDQAVLIRNQILQMEKEANKLKAEVRENTPSGILIPVNRRDLLSMLSKQDKIASYTKFISGLILGRKMQFPQEIKDNFLSYLTTCIETVNLAQEAIEELDSLVETGFKGREVDIVTKMVANLDFIEDKTDELQIILRQQLLDIEKTLYPVDVIFLYKIISAVGDLANIAESVGDKLEIMLIKG